jgi:hypothetical protein
MVALRKPRSGCGGQNTANRGRRSRRPESARRPTAVWLQPDRPVSGLQEHRRGPRCGGTPSHARGAVACVPSNPRTGDVPGLPLTVAGAAQVSHLLPVSFRARSDWGGTPARSSVPACSRLVTRPFPWAACGHYSLGMWLASRRRRGGCSSSRRGQPGRAQPPAGWKKVASSTPRRGSEAETRMRQAPSARMADDGLRPLPPYLSGCCCEGTLLTYAASVTPVTASRP